jgi:hypothetical protein
LTFIIMPATTSILKRVRHKEFKLKLSQHDLESKILKSTIKNYLSSPLSPHQPHSKHSHHLAHINTKLVKCYQLKLNIKAKNASKKCFSKSKSSSSAKPTQIALPAQNKCPSMTLEDFSTLVYKKKSCNDDSTKANTID